MREHERVVTGEESIGDVVQELLRDIGDLLRAELRLAMTEARSTAIAAIAGSGLLLIGAVAAFLGVMFLLLALTAAMATTMGFGLAALIVGILVLAIGVILGLIGYYRLSSTNLSFATTRETVQEDVEWLKRR